MGLRVRLQNLVNNPLVVESSDYNFAQSLLSSYERAGRLTAGRKHWLCKLEEKYNPETYVDPLQGNPEAEVILDLLSNSEVSSSDVAFLTSLKQAVGRWGKLTERQSEALSRIQERYSDEGLARRAQWSATYAERKNEAVIAAQYYQSNPPYYGDLAHKILNEEGFVPSEKQFNAITQNKYAQKVIASTLSEPLYAAGVMVEGRASSSPRIRGKKAFVLKTDYQPVVNAAKGAKRYLVLPVGEPSPVIVEEREIKRVKKLKKK